MHDDKLWNNKDHMWTLTFNVSNTHRDSKWYVCTIEPIRVHGYLSDGYEFVSIEKYVEEVVCTWMSSFKDTMPFKEYLEKMF